MVRPATAIISREKAASAALAVIDEQGLDKFSLHFVAARLGVKTPSLYHHFQGKTELLIEVAKLLLSEGKLPAALPGLDWREEIVRISLASWRSILRHRHAAPLLLHFFPRVLLVGAYEHWARLLTVNGIPAQWQMTIVEGSEKLTFGSALFVAAGQPSSHWEGGGELRHPYLVAARDAHRWSEEETFLICLRAFLSGLPLPDAPN